MKDLIVKLTSKQQNLARSLEQCHIAVLKLERQLSDAREARAACEGAKQQVDETLNALLEMRDAPTSAPR